MSYAQNKKNKKPILLLGLCSRGPYRHAEDLIINPTVDWISWGYFADYIQPDVLEDIKSKKIKLKAEVLFAAWDIGKEKNAKILRKGILDHIASRGNNVNFTVFLKERFSGFIEFPERDHFLCRYVDLKKAKKRIEKE